MHQRPALRYLLGLAKAQGIQVVLPGFGTLVHSAQAPIGAYQSPIRLRLAIQARLVEGEGTQTASPPAAAPGGRVDKRLSISAIRLAPFRGFYSSPRQGVPFARD